MCCCTDSAVSRAILKLVYQFGIPNSNPQMLKSVDFWCKLLSMFLVAEPREWCSELFRTQNSQKFPGFYPWTPMGRAYSTGPDSVAAQRFISSLHSSKNQHAHKKLLDAALTDNHLLMFYESFIYQWFTNPNFLWCCKSFASHLGKPLLFVLCLFHNVFRKPLELGTCFYCGYHF